MTCMIAFFGLLGGRSHLGDLTLTLLLVLLPIRGSYKHFTEFNTNCLFHVFSRNHSSHAVLWIISITFRNWLHMKRVLDLHSCCAAGRPGAKVKHPAPCSISSHMTDKMLGHHSGQSRWRSWLLSWWWGEARGVLFPVQDSAGKKWTRRCVYTATVS